MTILKTQFSLELKFWPFKNIYFLIYRSTNPNKKRFKISFSNIKYLSSEAVSKIDDLIDQASGWSLETLVTSSIRNLVGLAPLHGLLEVEAAAAVSSPF